MEFPPLSRFLQADYSLSRRTFMGGVAAGAFTVLSPGMAFGSEANSRIKAGVIGLGGRGRMIASMVRDHGGFEITAVADYFADLSVGVGEQYGVPKERCFHGLNGYQGLIQSGVEAVFLETPPYCFPDHAHAAVQAGCHVFMAKPVACDVPGTLRIAEDGADATRRNQVFMVDFQTRTEPINQEVVRQIHDGAVGPVAMLSSIYTDEGFADPPKTENAESRLRQLIWVNDDDLGGGYLVNAGIHAIDVALWMAGSTPLHAVGQSRLMRNDPHGDSHDVYSLTYAFSKGFMLNHRGEHLGNQHGFECSCIAYGRDGYAQASYGGEAFVHNPVGKAPTGEITGLYERGAIQNIAAFHEQIRAGQYENATVMPSVNANLAVILGREACKRGDRVSWEELIAENKRIEPDLSGLKS